MRYSPARFIGVLLMGALALPAPAPATDVDGPNDCQRSAVDFGDAPEGVFAYPGVVGHFPTCTVPTAPGDRTLACAPISTAPGLTGFVRHQHPAAGGGYWLGCPLTGGLPQGIDSEIDGKMNATGAPISVCNDVVPTDCVEAAFGMSFGQDECYGSTDAGIASPVSFGICTNSTVTFQAYNCATVSRQVVLNILVDWNQDGDWNDNYQCNTTCAFEWAVKNVSIVLGPGCNTVTSPIFMSGPNAGDGWMRISISDEAVNDNFPWAGTATSPGQQFTDGETEDYPVVINHTAPCPDYEDWGDAPEEVQAYPGIPGRFPTCSAVTLPGTQQLFCAPISTPPGPTGFVRHVSSSDDPYQFLLGCGDPAAGLPGVDSELDGKTNDTGGPISVCSPAIAVDCVEAAFGLNFGQDECNADGVDAGIAGPISFNTCTASTVTFKTFNCQTPRDVYLNILVDWNRDGDWNDNFQCGTGPNPSCAYEWAVKNQIVTLGSGCETHISPSFLAGPNAGRGWLRITLTATPVSDDFPWDGSAGGPAGQGFFRGGETEDYPVTIATPCQIDYQDFGDAPEGIAAYSTGIIGHFPTCIFPTAPGDQQLECAPPSSTPPAITGYVKHVALASDADHFWLGCGTPISPLSGIDSEIDGKVNLVAISGSISWCNDAVIVDCNEFADGQLYGQDECYGDADAGLASFVTVTGCSLGVVPYNAYNCSDNNTTVYLNILVDWNYDGDWNDMIACPPHRCAPEWAVKNKKVGLAPGCNALTSPSFQVGPREGTPWMRITLSSEPAPDDYPWNGSASLPGSQFTGGETEDYPIGIAAKVTGVEDGSRSGDLWFAPIVPNPARSGIVASYTLSRESDVSLVAYDIAGRQLAELARGRMQPGEHRVEWKFRDARGAEITSGYYVLKLRVGDRVLTQRGIRIR